VLGILAYRSREKLTDVLRWPLTAVFAYIRDVIPELDRYDGLEA